MIMRGSAKDRDPLNYIIYTLDEERRRCTYIRSTCILSKVLYRRDTGIATFDCQLAGGLDGTQNRTKSGHEVCPESPRARWCCSSPR